MRTQEIRVLLRELPFCMHASNMQTMLRGMGVPSLCEGSS